MDLDDFRSVLETAGVDFWTFMDTAILVASLDYGQELKERRDAIVQRLYATTMVSRCRNCDFGGGRDNGHNGHNVNAITEEEHVSVPKRGGVGVSRGGVVVGDESPCADTPVSANGDEHELDPYGGLFDDEQKRILEIKEQLEDTDQSEDSLVDLLQGLADMDITFQALKETDIGRHVNRLRKHSSNDVRRLAKQLVRKWKETVDEWVKVNQPGETQSAALMADEDSPHQKITSNGHRQQVPDFAYSPNRNNASSGSEKNNSEPERKPKQPLPQRKPQVPAKASHSSPAPAPAHVHAPPSQGLQRQKEFNAEKKLASATKRLQESYKEAENAKRQRTIQVMDIHEIPKPKNTYFSKNKGGGGGGSQGRHW